MLSAPGCRAVRHALFMHYLMRARTRSPCTLHDDRLQTAPVQRTSTKHQNSHHRTQLTIRCHSSPSSNTSLQAIPQLLNHTSTDVDVESINCSILLLNKSLRAIPQRTLSLPAPPMAPYPPPFREGVQDDVASRQSLCCATLCSATAPSRSCTSPISLRLHRCHDERLPSSRGAPAGPTHRSQTRAHTHAITSHKFELTRAHAHAITAHRYELTVNSRRFDNRPSRCSSAAFSAARGRFLGGVSTRRLS